MLKLIIEDDEGRKTVVPFVRDEITIGRQEGNTIRLTERNVSRRHARLVRQNGHVLVEDLGSYNGIRINGDKIQGQVPVHEGDLIQIGDYDLAVQQEGQQATSATLPLPSVPNGSSANGEAIEKTAPRAVANPSAAMTVKLPDLGATSPALPIVSDASATLGGEDDEGPEEADPDDVQSASGESDTGRRQSTAIIRVDQVDGNRPRQIVDIDHTEAPRLVVLNTDFAGREFACIRSELKIGRTEDNDIAIDHRSLSRTHCKIVREDTGEWRVLDMQSANGLMVNGEPYAQSALRTGDTLELGHVKFKFVGPGETFTLSTTAEGVAVKQGGSKLPMIAVSAAVIVALLGAGYWFVLRKRVGGNHPTVENPQPPPIVPPPPEVKPLPPEPVELTPEQVNAEREKKIAAATVEIEAGNWAKATDILKTCFVNESRCPEANRMLDAMNAEKGMKVALEAAEAALETGDLNKAKLNLDQAAAGKLLRKRFEAAAVRYKNDTTQNLARKDTTPVKPPEPRPVEVKPPEPPRPPAIDPRISEATTLFEEAKALSKDKQYPAARSKLEKCIKVMPKNPDCHKLLGNVWAKQGDSDKGAKEYREFIKYAPPDHPDYERVKQILEAFDHPK